MLRLYREFSCPIWHRLNLCKNHTYVWALIPTSSWENVMQSLNNVNRITGEHICLIVTLKGFWVARTVLQSSVSKRLAVFLAGHITCCTMQTNLRMYTSVSEGLYSGVNWTKEKTMTFFYLLYPSGAYLVGYICGAESAWKPPIFCCAAARVSPLHLRLTQFRILQDSTHLNTATYDVQSM